ncbi:hypothetical protein C7448_102190 [Tenacibaculum gallaicum]|uniref:Uncharacterized protein n=1 Tax=Tenacibaculum gallaicum TaxID=561505 RepID=A0A3E0I7Q3_9FLAO|nr:hypothetical protein [Tenacibaculum gallaicum]REH54667.1 hypothetical protein C7448_102190 [Tenacibaculum gallaicum]
MAFYNSRQTVTLVGVYQGYTNGYYIFELENGDIIDFDQINKKNLEHLDLKSSSLKNKSFEITYKEIFDDLDDEDIVIFKLENLQLL